MVKVILDKFIVCNRCKKVLTYETSDINKFTDIRDTIKCPNCGNIINVYGQR